MSDRAANGVDAATARRMWRLIEPIHSLTYFSPESTDALKSTGLRGYWMTYFAGRASPMGAVGASIVATDAPSPPRMPRSRGPTTTSRLAG